MAVRHTNPNAKVTSGYTVSGREADKVFAICLNTYTSFIIYLHSYTYLN